MIRSAFPLAPALLAFVACGASVAGDAAPAPASADRGPVVIELFTSQGCSSCPPADRLLSRLAEEPAYRGRVVPLAFHVDYWDYIGWRDPFSSPRWSERQRDYGRSLGLGTVYTPQLVIDGRSECVGSQEGDVRREIARALATPAAGRVELSVSRDGGDAAPATGADPPPRSVLAPGSGPCHRPRPARRRTGRGGPGGGPGGPGRGRPGDPGRAG